MKEMNSSIKNFMRALPAEVVDCYGYRCESTDCPLCLKEMFKIGGESTPCAVVAIQIIKAKVEENQNQEYKRRYRVSVLVNAGNESSAIDEAKIYFDERNVRVEKLE
jgi:hypothetical protein